MASHSYNPPGSSNDGETADRLEAADAKNAADLIRAKVARIYNEEPSATQARREADAELHHSKHQRFMHELSTCG